MVMSPEELYAARDCRGRCGGAAAASGWPDGGVPVRAGRTARGRRSPAGTPRAAARWGGAGVTCPACCRRPGDGLVSIERWRLSARLGRVGVPLILIARADRGHYDLRRPARRPGRRTGRCSPSGSSGTMRGAAAHRPGARLPHRGRRRAPARLVLRPARRDRPSCCGSWLVDLGRPAAERPGPRPRQRRRGRGRRARPPRRSRAPAHGGEPLAHDRRIHCAQPSWRSRRPRYTATFENRASPTSLNHRPVAVAGGVLRP